MDGVGCMSMTLPVPRRSTRALQASRISLTPHLGRCGAVQDLKGPLLDVHPIVTPDYSPSLRRALPGVVVLTKFHEGLAGEGSGACRKCEKVGIGYGSVSLEASAEIGEINMPDSRDARP